MEIVFISFFLSFSIIPWLTKTRIKGRKALSVKMNMQMMCFLVCLLITLAILPFQADSSKVTQDKCRLTKSSDKLIAYYQGGDCADGKSKPLRATRLWMALISKPINRANCRSCCEERRPGCEEMFKHCHRECKTAAFVCWQDCESKKGL